MIPFINKDLQKSNGQNLRLLIKNTCNPIEICLTYYTHDASEVPPLYKGLVCLQMSRIPLSTNIYT